MFYICFYCPITHKSPFQCDSGPCFASGPQENEVSSAQLDARRGATSVYRREWLSGKVVDDLIVHGLLKGRRLSGRLLEARQPREVSFIGNSSTVWNVPSWDWSMAELQKVTYARARTHKNRGSATYLGARKHGNAISCCTFARHKCQNAWPTPITPSC